MEVSERTLNELVRENPDRLGLFQELGLDACCGGELTLAESCREHGVDLDEVVAELDLPANPGESIQ